MITEILTVDQEEKATISINVSEEQWQIQIDNHITPLYCCNCKMQLDNLYKLDGGRYGQVGTIFCKCGAEIHCVDSDNMVDYLDTTTIFENKIVGTYHIDFKQLYRLNNSNWALIKENIGYDIFNECQGQTMGLEEILNEIIFRFDLTIDSSTNYNTSNFRKLPATINKWFGLLNLVEK